MALEVVRWIVYAVVAGLVVAFLRYDFVAHLLETEMLYDLFCSVCVGVLVWQQLFDCKDVLCPSRKAGTSRLYLPSCPGLNRMYKTRRHRVCTMHRCEIFAHPHYHDDDGGYQLL